MLLPEYKCKYTFSYTKFKKYEVSVYREIKIAKQLNEIIQILTHAATWTNLTNVISVRNQT
jgi:hypothetical protein